MRESPKTCQYPRQTRRENRASLRGEVGDELASFGVSPFHLLSLLCLAEKAFMATAVRVGTVQPVVPFPVSSNASQMQVRKRNGSLQPAAVNKIVRAFKRCGGGLRSVDTIRIASKTIGGLFNGATTKELDLLSI